MDNQEAPQKENAPATDTNSSGSATTSSAKTNVMAIVAIIFAFIVPIVGLILGIVALSQIKKNKEEGKGLAIASIVLSSVFIVVYLFVLIIFWGAIFAIDKAAKDAGVKVNTNTGTVSVNKDGESTQIGSDVKLPSGFPSAMPIYSGSKLSAASKTNNTDFYVLAYTSDKPEKVSEYYKATLPQKGWTINNTNDTSSEFGTGTYIDASNSTDDAKVNIYGDSKDKTIIQITVTPKTQQ